MHVGIQVGRGVTAVALCLWLAACGATRAAVPPPSQEELPRRVLLLREAPDGSFTQEWRPAGEFDLARYVRAPEGRRIVRTARSVRDCDAENRECIQQCMSTPLPRGYGHVRIPRGSGGKNDHCVKQCEPAYRDCLELEKLRPQELSSTEALSDWASRHRESLLVGSVIVIAGVAFVVVSAGAGLIILAPALLMTAHDSASVLPLAETRP
ncbi:hypothetical protein HNS30_29260 [Corallococcus exercitus]|uniref:Uncharacterized protein n=1 Tax=Corallococcus exercitus TaxID=2316736 RepID=A0A7Y4NG86_9BACT|nr:hypothetical protein [Corallococcus exercitus]NOK13137.1 hypothetical protein [Corallococcus exercitus]